MSELDISSATDTSLITSVQTASYLVREQLTKVALSPEYDEITGLAFGDNYDRQVAESLWQSFAQGDLSELPDIQVISSDILGNANGAYAEEIDTIFLSDDFVRSHNTQEIAGVLIEEIGHSIDNRINTVDAAGDEGDIFSRLVRGESLSGAELALLRQEDDSGFINLNDRVIAVEFQDFYGNAISSSPGGAGFTKNNGGWTTFNDYPRTLADVNGDGKADIVGFGMNQVLVSLSNGNGTFKNAIGSSPGGAGFTKNNGGWTTSEDYPRTLADVNGDGKADIVGFGINQVFVSLSNGNGTFQNAIASSPGGAGFTKNNGGWTTFNDYPRTLADVNGDGKADIVGFGINQVFVSLSNGNGTFQNAIASSPGGAGFTKNNGGWTTFNDYPRTLADVNGDGKADIVGFGINQVFVSLSNGNGTFQNAIASSPGGAGFTKNNGGWTTFNDYPRTLADFNGDGKADIVGFGINQVFVSLSNGNGTFQNAISSSPGGAGFTKNNRGWTTFNDFPRILADVNGDRRADIVGFGGSQVLVSLVSDWYSQNLRDAGLVSLTRSLANDGKLSRNDMISIFRNAKDGSVIDANELTDLRTIVSNSSRFAMDDFVKVLSNKIANSDPANNRSGFGNLYAGSSATQMENLIGKWFLGNDRPDTSYSYQYTSGSLFQNGISADDIEQNALGDCYYLATLSSIAQEKPSYIQNMFIDNGDNTFTVRFFNKGVADYVTVDRYLPTSGGYQVYAGWGGGYYTSSSNELWVALSEKAYAQLAESGWSRSRNSNNSYSDIEGGWMDTVIRQVTGLGASLQSVNNMTQTQLINLVNSNQILTVGFVNGAGFGVVNEHAYTITSYNSYNRTFHLRNPWGYNHADLTWSQLLALQGQIGWSNT